MIAVPVAETLQTSYENFTARCPHCGSESVFNRASDLRTFEPIAGLDVSCLSCGKTFRIVGDSVNERHEMLIFDCYELMQRKHYMNTVLTLCQAYEVFFSLFLRVELLYKPFGADPEKDIDELNRVSGALQAKLKDRTFVPMRSLFLRHVVSPPAPNNLTDAASVIAALPGHSGDPKDAAIEGLTDTKLVTLLKSLKATSINSLRNDVVHKRAYRPTRSETEAALDEARAILIPLGRRLQVHDDVNWYTRNP